ncbi:uncharacterized protein EAE98_001781 [Botrytis deweyae]|uniref:Uncharacterized protein n=1 Tax=Botrytis deweyae TaxID=2478750 RepID=A0ABQ7IZC1_9HELO|nr:uncharacterized protein EAE98_001781 [Botrytis deweyae]KAF7937467.1 hypothetical protein EAE98_001781 [Botrytis deweyae]
MDRGMSETDSGMDFIEQWDWQRFREAESMELEDEEDSAMQTQVSIENGEKVKETTRDVNQMGEVGEVDPRGSQSMILPQYDGPADDEDVIEENGSVSKIDIDDIDVGSRQVILLQCDDQAVSISKTGSGDVDVSSRHDDTAASNIPTEEGLNKNAPVAQKQRMVTEDFEPYKEESGAISEKHDDTADEQEDQEMNLAGDKSIPDFPGAEIGDQELVKVDEPALLEETRKNALETITTTTEMTIDSSLNADVDPFGGNMCFEKQIYDKSDDKIKDSGSSSENIVSERGNDISNSEKAITEMGAGPVIDKPIVGENNQIEEICGNVTSLNTTHSETTVETEKIVDKDANSGNEDHGTESITSGFLSNEDLRDLEGKPSSISILEQSPVEFAPGDNFPEGVPSVDENVASSANLDNTSNLTHIQVLRIPNQLPVDDESLDDVELPSLSRLEAPVQARHVEIPDSDAITESSQQSPQKLSHNGNTFDSSARYGKNVEMTIGADAAREENEDAEAEDVISSFGRECATSSIDPKKNLKELEMMESETPQNGIDDFDEIGESFQCAPIGSTGKVEEYSRADEDDMDIHPPSIQTSPQKPTDKMGRSTGIRRSQMANRQADEESIESKAMLVEAGPDKPISVEDKEDLSVSSPVAERKQRGRLPTGKISALSVDEHVDKLDDALKHIASTDATADDSSTNSPAPEKRKRGRPASRKVSLLSPDGLAMEEDKAALDSQKSYEATIINKSAEAYSSPRKLPADKLYPSNPTPEKRKRGRPPGRKTSTLSTVKNDDDDLEREQGLMDEKTIQSNISHKSTDERPANPPIHFMQEEKRKGVPTGRKSSDLIPEKNYSDGPDGELDELDDVTAIAPVEIIESHDESGINDTMDELTANSSSPVKRKRGRPASRKSSGLSLEKPSIEEVTRHYSSNVSVIIPGDIETEQATPSQKSTGKHIAITSPSVKRKRGRPAGRKSSGVEAEHTEADELLYDASPLTHNDVDVQAAPPGEAHDDSDGSSSVRPKKRGRSGRKISELNSEKIRVNEAVNESSRIVVTEETLESIAKESIGDVHSTDELADLDSSPVKRKRGRPAGRKVSRLSPEKTTVNEASEKTPDIPNKAVTDASVCEPASETQSVDEPQTFANKSPEKKRRGRPGSRKVSEVTNPNKGSVKPPEESQVAIALQETVGVSIDQPAVISSSPEKKKRGRPARKASSLNARNATMKDMSNDVISSGKDIPNEIVDSDEEEDALLNESPPSKKVKPGPRMRGRPPGTKDLGASTEDAKSGEENLTGVLTDRAESGGKNQVVTQIEEKPPASEKKKRGRPSTTKARRISNSDSDVAEEEQQVIDKGELRSIESEDPDEEEEAIEQEEPVIEKKKRGRPSLLKNKGKQSAKAAEPVDKDATINDTPITGGINTKLSGSQVSTSSNTSASHRQDAFLAEIKAMKLTSIQTRNASLKAEIAQKREQIQEITEGLEKPAKQTVKRHIKLLHDYNDIKDVGQGLLGMIADNRGVRVGELYEEFGVGIAD